MSMTYSDPFDVLLSLQRALEARRASDWLRDATTSMGSFPEERGDFVHIELGEQGMNREDKGRGGKAARDFCDVMQCLTRRVHNG